MSAILEALRFFRHMRVLPESKETDSLDIRDLRDGRQVTIGYARSQREADEFNRAFEHIRLLLSRPDAEAIAAAPELAGRKALVLYFETDEDMAEVVAMFREVKPNVRTVKV